jgi:septal ring factor EnvC (AmiA/AmiB activator)
MSRGFEYEGEESDPNYAHFVRRLAQRRKRKRRMGDTLESVHNQLAELRAENIELRAELDELKKDIV